MCSAGDRRSRIMIFWFTILGLMVCMIHGDTHSNQETGKEESGPLKGFHLADEDSAVHFGPNFECKLGFDAGPPPKIVSSCPVDSPPPPSPPPPPATPPPWTLLLASDLSSRTVGDFASGTQVGSPDSTSGDYRIGKTGAQLNALGIQKLRISTDSGHTQDFDGPFDGNAFDNTCTVDYRHDDCFNRANLGHGLYWTGGTSNAKTWSTHFGLVKHADIHVVCGGGGEADDKWGHFHRNGFNTGIYVFGDTCTP